MVSVSDFEIKGKIVAYLRRQESGASASEIAKSIDHNRITVGKYLQVLKAEQVVTSKNVASAIYWQLADFSKKYKVLIVDDEKHIVDLIRLSLAGGRYDLYEAYDGKEALDMIAEIVPDLIILDLMMPRVSGVEVAKQLKSNVFMRNIPILVLSARGDTSDKTALLDIGVDDYVTKPFDPLELEARVQNRLRKKENQFSQNPVTGLPSTIVTQETRRLWSQKKKWREYNIEIVNFDDFAGIFGHKRSFEVLQIFVRMLTSELADAGGDPFIGHLSDSEFAVFSETDLNSVEEIRDKFDKILPYLYSDHVDLTKKDYAKITLPGSSVTVDHSLLSLEINIINHG